MSADRPGAIPGPPYPALRILMVLPNFPPMVGGAQRWGEEVARHLHAAGHAIAVVAPRRLGDDAVDAALPFPVHRCRVAGDAMAFSGISAIHRHVRRFRPDVILAGHWSGAHAALRATGERVPVACAVHGREIGLRPLKAFAPAQWVYDRVRAYAFDHVDAFLCVSRHNWRAMAAAGVAEARLHVVANGVDAGRFARPVHTGLFARLGLSGRQTLLTCARLVPLKGIDMVIEALPAMIAQVPSLVYVILGDGPDRQRLEELVVARGLGGYVVFVGNLDMGDPDLLDAYQTCDLFVMISRDEPPLAEGFGLVFLEAAAAGKPVVGSWVGGIPDAVIDGQTGLLVDPRDPAAIAHACLRFLQNPEMARQFGQAGLADVQACRGWDQVAERTARVLAGLTASPLA